jgi:hypothetical protein
VLHWLFSNCIYVVLFEGEIFLASEARDILT